MKRQHIATSSAGHDRIKPFKANHKSKIADALEKLKVGATHEEAAEAAGMRPDQVWKRCSEMQRDGTIFDTGITRKLKSGVAGIVWQLSANNFPNTVIRQATQTDSIQPELFT